VKKTCEKCKAISKESAKFCHDCGAPLDSSEEKFVIKEDDSPIDVGEIVGEVTKSRVAKVGLVILVATLVLILVLNGLPVAKATNNEEKYSAYYNSYLEKLDGSDPKAPRELIDDNELEDIYLQRLAQAQIGLMLMIPLCIIMIVYGNFYKPNEKIDRTLKNILKKATVCLICFVLHGALSLIGLSIEKFIEEGVAILPLISIYYMCYAIFILKFIGKIKTEKKLKHANYRLDYIFETAIYSILAIPMLPWLCAILIQEGNANEMIYNETSILAAGQSQFTVYELSLLAGNLENIFLILWSVVLMSILGEVGINLVEEDYWKNRSRKETKTKNKSLISDSLILASNSITLLAIGIIYFHLSFFFNVEKFETYINEVVNNGDTNTDYFFVPNYAPLLFSIFIFYQSIKFNSLTLKKSYERLSNRI